MKKANLFIKFSFWYRQLNSTNIFRYRNGHLSTSINSSRSNSRMEIHRCACAIYCASISTSYLRTSDVIERVDEPLELGESTELRKAIAIKIFTDGTELDWHVVANLRPFSIYGVQLSLNILFVTDFLTDLKSIFSHQKTL